MGAAAPTAPTLTRAPTWQERYEAAGLNDSSVSSLLNKHEVVKVISQSLKITTTNTRIYSTSWQLPTMNNVATTNFEKNLLTRKL